MQQQYPRGIRVLVCGGGNAAHVFAGQLSARGALTTMLSTFPGEADAIKLGLNGSPSANQPAVDRGIAVRNWPLDRSGSNFGTVRGTPISVASRVESAFTPSASSTTDSMEYEYYDVIVLALPACAHDRYLASMAPYLAYPHPTRPPTVLCAAVAQGGFDLAVNASLTAAGVTSTVIIAGLEALPWACRLVSRGSECEILGSKSQVDVAVAVYTPNGSSSGVGDVGKSTAKNAADLLKRHTPRALEMLQAVVGHTPRLHLASGFLGVTLMNINSLWHPTMMYHRWYKEWDGRETFVSPPPFYEGASDDMGASAVAMSEEVVKVCDALRARYGGKGGRLLLDDLSTVRKAYDWLIRAYGDEAAMDRTSVATMLRTNPAYRGQTHPMKNLAPRDSSGPATPDVKPRLVPDYHHRYLSEDIPYGALNLVLVVVVLVLQRSTINTFLAVNCCTIFITPQSFAPCTLLVLHSSSTPHVGLPTL